MLHNFCNNQLTDKNTTHSYIDLYESLFFKKRDTATHVLEVGIGQISHQNGGSIRMWADYFKNADIYALDIIHVDHVHGCIRNDPRIHLLTSQNAYDPQLVQSKFIDKNIKFDMMLDDGPHSLDSMVSFIKLYSGVMKEDGILVIEDVQDIAWIDILHHVTPDGLKPFIEVYDRRSAKGRYDDIVFVINKSKSMI
jgi:hypothetical protein